jgi:hypothetical protein
VNLEERRIFDGDGNVVAVELTREAWKRKHSDYKVGRLGKDARCLALDKGATVLVPARLLEGGR